MPKMTMHTYRDQRTEAVRVGIVLIRWRSRIAVRSLIHQVRHTLHGKLGLGSAAVLTVMLAPIVAGGFLDTIPETSAGLDGLLLAAHLWLALPLALMILVQLAKAFVEKREDEPLTAHPAHFPCLARHRVLTAFPLASFAFVGLFYAYFWQLPAGRLSRLWLAIPIHLFTTAMLVFASGIVMGAIGRPLLRAALNRGMRDGNTLVNGCGAAAMTLFAVLLLGIIVANKHAPGVFETIGHSAAVALPLGMVPFAAASAAEQGRWLALTGWLGLTAAAAGWAATAAYRWSFSAHREIPLDLATPARLLFAPLFTGRQRRWLPAGVTAFWRKDIVVPYSREPKRYLFHHVNLLWWCVVAVTLAMTLRDRGNISAAFADTAPVLLVLAAMALLAMLNGVNALGREGKELTWLRPIFAASQLLIRKLLVNWTYVLVHGVAYAIVAYTASRAASLSTSFWVLLSYAVGAGAVFATLATAIGFLLPDFERRSSSLPGAAAVGQYAYIFAALLLAGITGAAHLLLRAGFSDAAVFAGTVTFELICASAGTSLIAAAAIRKYRGMEI